MAKKRVLISVSDKTGIVEFARTLQEEFSYEIISTGGTKKLLQENGLPVKGIEEITGFPEMLDGRVKTLHPAIHGGLLALREKKEHLKALKDLDIDLIDMLVVNLYPFRETLEKKAPFEEIIENIDIGGPSMLRSAAKNYQSVTVVPGVEWYETVLQEMRTSKGEVSSETKKELAAAVFFLTAQYDSAISTFLSEGGYLLFPAERIENLRYGENPHQEAVALRDPRSSQEGCITGAVQLQGKPMSFLNYYDADSALQMILEFDEPAAVFVKHGNPCGLASDPGLLTAFQNAYECDPRSAFGVIIALNRPVTVDIAREIIKKNIFVEVLLSDHFDDQAVQILSEKKNMRLLKLKKFSKPSEQEYDLKKILGGYLLQGLDVKELSTKDLQMVTTCQPTEAQIQDLLFAWKVVKHVKSNAIVLAKGKATMGIGAGQMSRVDSTEIAVRKAGERAKNSVLASDAFFPFPDSVDEAHKNGIVAIVQPGGSVNDEAVIKQAETLKIPMFFTGVRAFRH